MNRSAVALAADSAATIQWDDGWKAFAANKLLMLVEGRPVGVMVYGGAEFMGIPWETIIKLARSRYGRAWEQQHLNGYADDLLSFIVSELRSFIPADALDEDLRAEFSYLLLRVQHLIDDRFKESIHSGGAATERSRMVLAARTITQQLNEVRSLPFLEGMTEKDARRVRRDQSAALEHAVDNVIRPDLLSDASRKKLFRLCAESVVRWDRSSPRLSGLVVAGFGEGQLFPSLREFLVYGFLEDKLRYVRVRESDISLDSGAYVAGFAQEDMVATFMEGADPEYREFGRQYVGDLLSGLPELMTTGLGLGEKAEKAVQDRAQRLGAELAEMIDQNLTAFRRQIHVDPVLSMIANMPKEELAEVAEALVNLTSMKRRTSFVPESVGGPVDVAVISKGDGFVWMQRKHYFPSELNPRFIARHYNQTGRQL